MIRKVFFFILRIILKKYNNIRYFYILNLFVLLTSKITIGKKYRFSQKTRITGIGKVIIGNNSSFGFKLGGFFYGPGIELQARTINSKIVIGDNLATNNNILIISSGSIEIGDDCLIGQNVTIMDFEAHGIAPDKRREIGEIGKVHIGNNVWIGNNVVVLKNVVIGENSVIAAGSIVTKSIPENVIAGGIPCRVIKAI
jgi:acetyltransferase-like isoleucine patch superfamily enzyme